MHDDEREPQPAVVYGETSSSPARGPADSLRFILAPGRAGEPPLVLHGCAHLRSETAGRYSGHGGEAVTIVAVSRESGHVHICDLTPNDSEDEVMPPKYLGADASPAIVLVGRSPGQPTGITIPSYFRVDLKRHLGLGDAASTYDVFLWLDDLFSEVASAGKPAEPGDRPPVRRSHRPSSVASVRAASGSSGLELGWAERDGARRIVGRAGSGPVSLVAHAVESREQGWTVLQAPAKGGLELELEVRDLLPYSRPNERVLAFALAGGRRSALLDSG